MNITNFKPVEDVSDLIVFWKRTNSTRWHNYATGKSGDSLEEVKRGINNIIVEKKSGIKYLEGFYLSQEKDDNGNDVIFIRACWFQIRYVPKEGDIRSWNIGREGLMISKDNDYCYEWVGYTSLNFNTAVDITSTCGDIKTLPASLYRFSYHTTKVLQGFFGNTGFSYQGFPVSYRDDTIVGHLMQIKKTKSPAKKQAEIDELVKKELPKDFTAEQKEFIFKDCLDKIGPERGYKGDMLDWNNMTSKLLFLINRNSYKEFGVVERVPETDICVIRVFKGCFKLEVLFEEQRMPESLDDLEYFEFMRMYVRQKDIICCQKTLWGWQYMKKGIKNYHFYFSLIPWNKEDAKGTRLEFMESIREDVISVFEREDTRTEAQIKSGYCRYSRTRQLSTNLRCCLESPLIESLFSADYPNLRKNIFAYTHNQTPKEIITMAFGEVDFEQRSLTKAIGVPGFMLAELDARADRSRDSRVSYLTDGTSTIAYLKNLFSDFPEYFQRMNKDMYCSILDKMISKPAPVLSYFVLVKNMMYVWGPGKVVDYIDYIDELMNQREKFYKSPLYSYMDYCQMVKRYKDVLPNTRWKLEIGEEIYRLHDEVTFIINNMTYDSSGINAKFEKLHENWEKYEYEEEEFCVIAPKNAAEVANEGLALSHCVKSYIDTIAEGKTQIYFIRKTEDKDTPFFTLEVKDRKVRQCHGKCNSNVEPESSLEAFLKRYCTTNKIRFEDGTRCLAAD